MNRKVVVHQGQQGAAGSPGDGAIPLRKFGRHDVRISALGFGGHHLGDAQDEQTAIKLVHEAVDNGITFFDNCWEYHRGKSENWMGKGLKGLRDKVFLMTKVCTHGRDGSLALQMLEESLNRLQTDHLDHLRMLQTDFPFDAVQMPLNSFDANFHSFEIQVLPELIRRGIAPLGMKPMSGHGEPIQQGAVSAEEALRYAMSLPVATTITGMERSDVLQQNLKVAQGFQPMTPEEMQALRDRTREVSTDGHFELYKVSLKFDNPEARMAHGFPLDLQSAEVKEMIQATVNTGHPYPVIPK